jgi:hypothetical protein
VEVSFDAVQMVTEIGMETVRVIAFIEQFGVVEGTTEFFGDAF